MFIYLSKKIAIPNSTRLRALSWNPEQGWIACGGDEGLLKVLKLESSGGVKKAAAPSNLSMNQTLDGHHRSVMCVTWNANYSKLTTSDENGLIIVWMLHKGIWFEEMINNRNKSVVRDMKWTADGQKICIVYEDGAVIVGSVDGNRLWGKELNIGLTHVEWSPDSRYILFVTSQNNVDIYDVVGTKVKTLSIFPEGYGGYDDREAGAKARSEGGEIIGLNWYDGAEGHADPNAPTLAVAYAAGRVVILRGTEDSNPVILESRLALSQAKWNTRGTVLALAGTTNIQDRSVSVVRFYDPYGNFLQKLKVYPGGSISALSWEGGGLRIALAVEAFIFFANIRPDYVWAFFAGTLVYSYPLTERAETCVVFWNVKSDDAQSRHVKYFARLRELRAAGDNCVLVLGPNDDDSYSLMLCNAIGSPVDVKPLSITPRFVVMTPFHIVVSDYRTVYVWQYRTKMVKVTSAEESNSTGALLRRNAGRERMFDIDSRSATPAQVLEAFTPSLEHPNDPIAAITASDKHLIVARESGTCQRYELPHVSLDGRFDLNAAGGNNSGAAPQQLALNCTSTLLSVIDTNGVLSIVDLAVGPGGSGARDAAGNARAGPTRLETLERKDAWSLKWAEDDEDSLAVMEKTRMHVFHRVKQNGEYTGDWQQEDAVVSSTYLSRYSNLQITAVAMDDIMANPDRPTKALVVELETAPLRELSEMIANKGLAAAHEYIAEKPHPQLWQTLAENALEALDLPVADKAFVRCANYRGIAFTKRLLTLSDKMKQRAEVCVYFQRFDEAESIFREIDRKDLAIELRMRLGDWSRVELLIKSGGGDDELLRTAWNKLGDAAADRFAWAKAAAYYSQAKNLPGLADALYRQEDYEGLVRLIHTVPEGHTQLLLDLAAKFESVGIHEHAITAYIKAGEVKAAIDCCVVLNQWASAVELAEKYDFPQVEGLLAKYASQLLQKGERLQAVELYRRSGKSAEAATLLADIAEQVGVHECNPLRAKRLHVLAALEVERYRKKVLDQSATKAGTDVAQATAATLDTLMTQSSTGAARVLDNAWRGAAAYHYLLLAHRQLYKGDVDAAMLTAIRLAEFEDVLAPRDIYSLIALAAYHNRYFAVCSRAFIKLETLPGVSDSDKEAIQTLAVSIFTQHPPNDPAPLHDVYTNCLEHGSTYQACVSSGAAIIPGSRQESFMCRTCRYPSLESDAHQCCPLCHSKALHERY